MYYKVRQCFIAIVIYESSAYYKLRQDVITIYDSLVIPILDDCYYNLRQVVQFTTTVITILRQVLQFTTLLQFTTKYTCIIIRKTRASVPGKIITSLPKRVQLTCVISVIAENKPHVHHKTYLHTTKVVTILIPSFHGLR